MRELKVVGLDVDGKRIICESDDAEREVHPARRRPATRRRARRQVRIQPIPTRCRGSKRAESQGDSSEDSRGRIRRAGRGVGRCRRRPSRAVRPSGAAGTLARGRAGNRRPPGSRRRSRGAHAAGDRHDGAGLARTRPRRHQLGRVAQRGRSLDGAAVLEGRSLGERRALPLHAGCARRHGDGVRRRRMRTDRPRLRPATAAAGGAGRPAGGRGARTTGPGRNRYPSHAKPARTPRARKGKPPVPAWEDVLLGVRSSGQAANRASSASSASQAPATPTPRPSTNHRNTGVARQPHTVGASPPTATRLRPTATSGWTRINPILSTTTAAAVTIATNAATARPVPHGVASSVIGPI